MQFQNTTQKRCNFKIQHKNVVIIKDNNISEQAWEQE